MEKKITQYMELTIPFNEILKKYKVDKDYEIDDYYLDNGDNIVFILSKEVQ